MIRESLSGKRIAITGSTGFLGTALVERFLRSVPDCELVLLVRPGRRGAEHRVKRDILKNDAFDRLRDAFKEDPVAAGGLDGETATQGLDGLDARCASTRASRCRGPCSSLVYG